MSTPIPRCKSRRRTPWLTIVAALLTLGIALARHYGSSLGFDSVSRAAELESITELGVVVSATLQFGEMVRDSGDDLLWFGAMGMLAPLFVAYSRAVTYSRGMLVPVVTVLVAALWVALSFACDRRRRPLALRALCLCGGLAAATVLWTWGEGPLVRYTRPASMQKPGHGWTKPGVLAPRKTMFERHLPLSRELYSFDDAAPPGCITTRT